MKKINSKDKVSLATSLEVERKDQKKGYDFVARSAHLLDLEEQKLKTKEIEDKTK